MKAVAYCRVSTDDQTLGLEAQRSLIASYAAAHQLEVVATEVDENVSGATDMEERDGLMRAMGEIKLQKAPVLLVAKRDRIARDVYVAIHIERACASLGAQVVCADGNANGESDEMVFMRRILDSAAEYERRRIRRRVKDALAVKKAHGELTGNAPLGYKIGAVISRGPGKKPLKMLEPDESEMGVVAFVKRAREFGHSYRGICQRLELEGYRTRTGEPFHPEQVRRMVSR